MSELDYGSIDHASELESCWFFSILENDDQLLRYLSAGRVYTGNDGEDELAMCYSARPTLTDYDEGDGRLLEVPNPKHDEEKYEYFFKGN